MYESMTFENIMNRMLERIPKDMDTRESSVMYNALAPAAAELAQMYIELDMMLDSTFADTSTGVYLERRCAERGIKREPATNAIVEGTFSPTNIDVLGQRFSCGDYNYIVTEATDVLGVYKMKCESVGTGANGVTGTLIPVDYIDGLESSTITALLIPAEDEEDDDSLRARYYATLDSESYGGNINDYKTTTNKIAGVGGTKVTPVWNGGGTVKLTIIASDFTVPTSTLIETVQNIIDPTQDATGLGKAPIGHIVTVVGVRSKVINISSNITYQSGWDWSTAGDYVKASIESYLEELRQSWSESENLIVRTSVIESRILSSAGVLDTTGTKINGSTDNMILEVDEIPVKGTISDGS